MSDSPAEITQLLQAASAGKPGAADRVIALLYQQLRTLARGRLRRSGEFTLLDTTALVHEGYLRLQGAYGASATAGAGAGGPAFADRHHFFAYAARAMHSVVVDLVRARQAERRGAAAEHLRLDTAIADSLAAPQDDEILRVHDALQDLAAVDARLASVVEMRYFGGLSEAEIALTLGITERTVQRDWQKARLLLALALK
jgi:RNA polymerase sigma factor (TIGR02999 family)